ncbi:MAG: zinc ribbon domain-containing protein [Oscillospiraceae bacterium]|nr:zinc ribbon domain-containing protein [Oscillospiraceae bacterium]
MGVSEKVAYLKGLLEGLKLDEDSDNAKVFRAIVDVMDEVALEIEDLTDEVRELGDGLDVISDDLSDVEDLVFEDEDDEDDEDEDDEEDEDDDEPVYATTCPECEKEIFFDETYIEDGAITCPNCGAKLEFDAEDINGGEDED